MTSLCWHH